MRRTCTNFGIRERTETNKNNLTECFVFHRFFDNFVEMSKLVPAEEYEAFEGHDDRFEKMRARQLAAEQANK